MLDNMVRVGVPPDAQTLQFAIRFAVWRVVAADRLVCLGPIWCFNSYYSRLYFPALVKKRALGRRHCRCWWPHKSCQLI